VAKTPRVSSIGNQTIPIYIKAGYACAALLIPALAFLILLTIQPGHVIPTEVFGVIIIIYPVRAVAQVIRKRSPIQSFEPWRFTLFGSIAFSLYALAFSTTYYALGGGTDHCLAGPASADKLTHLDSLYFTITTLTTTGFGDWHPSSEACRGVVVIQLITGFILFVVMLGVVLSVLGSLLRAGQSH
jgi:hypothetical protein